MSCFHETRQEGQPAEDRMPHPRLEKSRHAVARPAADAPAIQSTLSFSRLIRSSPRVRNSTTFPSSISDHTRALRSAASLCEPCLNTVSPLCTASLDFQRLVLKNPAPKFLHGPYPKWGKPSLCSW